VQEVIARYHCSLIIYGPIFSEMNLNQANAPAPNPFEPAPNIILKILKISFIPEIKIWN